MTQNRSIPICGPPRCLAIVLILALGFAPAVLAQWVQFTNETSARIVAESGLGLSDPEEKAYAWGDVDKDGDLDLAVVRKEPILATGKRVNVMFMNQGGTLTDRTSDFATDSDIPGDQGFKTPTSDRDVILVDVDLDGWLDMVTSVALAVFDFKHIGYPRVYHNKCCAVGGCAATSCSTEDWLGFRYEDARIPAMLTDDGQAGFNPCFCSVAAGDLNGDTYPDLYFADYDDNCGGPDFNDKLLFNKGAAQPGYFYDVTETSFIDGAASFPDAGFAASSNIAKFNQDGKNDILKNEAGFVGLAYSVPAGTGVFDKQNSPYGGSAYFVSYGELNNDGKLDLAVSDDGQDRYFLNQGDGGDAMADFISFGFSYANMDGQASSGDDGFGGNSIFADLNNDGFNDILVTDVDVQIAGCGRRTHIYRNLGGPSGSDVTLEEQTTGTSCSIGNQASCLVASIPANKLQGTHDVAVFDINGDGWKDLVLGRCSGTEVYMNVPPFPPAGGVPDGDEIPGTQLTVDRSGTMIQLDWGASCSLDDSDYAVYQGTIGNFTSHNPAVCSTGGATNQTLLMPPGSVYYLVAPLNGAFQGSLGRASNGQPRHAGLNACKVTSVGQCD
jgi:hypothetical protein